jgi:hypothetical protein
MLRICHIDHIDRLKLAYVAKTEVGSPVFGRCPLLTGALSPFNDSLDRASISNVPFSRFTLLPQPVGDVTSRESRATAQFRRALQLWLESLDLFIKAVLTFKHMLGVRHLLLWATIRRSNTQSSHFYITKVCGSLFVTDKQ